jgi:hypothetical protein
MQNLIPILFVIGFVVYWVDQQVLATLQRQGKYDPKTYRSIMSVVFMGPFVLLFKHLFPSTSPDSAKTESPELMPTGDLSQFSYDSTVCMNRLNRKVRLSYFFDDNQHAWYKIEKINHRGVPTDSPKFEPATVPFDVKKLQYV